MHIYTYVLVHTLTTILTGRMLYGEKKYSSNHSFRRPYGCAGNPSLLLLHNWLCYYILVFDILEILRGAIGETPESIYADEHHCFMPIFVW